MALADARDFRRIQNPGWRESAAGKIAKNANANPAYQEALEKAAPKVAQEVKDVRARETLNFNTLAPYIEKQQQQLAGEEVKAAQPAVNEKSSKEVWLEAASRGMHIKGYSPTEQDKADLANRVSKSETNKIEKGNKPFRAREKEAEEVKPDSQNKRVAETFANQSATDAVKAYPELAGAVAAVAAMEKKAEADGLNPQQRAVVSARIHQNVMNSIERGDIPKVKIKEDIEIKREPKEEREYAR
jgi:hypothetical protein